MSVPESIDKETNDIYKSSSLKKNDLKMVISDYLADKAILDRNDLIQSIKRSLVKNNIIEIKEDKHTPNNVARKSVSDDDGISISD